MQAIRETRRVSNNQVIIQLPDEFISKEVEIIVLPINEKETSLTRDAKASFFEFANTVSYKLPKDYRFNRDEL